MKKILAIILGAVLVSFTTINTRTVTGTTATIVTADDGYIILHTGAAATYTLGTVSDGFSCKIVNHGTGEITFSTAIFTGSTGHSTTKLSNYFTILEPDKIGNSIQITKIGGDWRVTGR